MITLHVNEHSSEKMDRLIQLIKETPDSYLEMGDFKDGDRTQFLLIQKKPKELAKLVWKVNLPNKEFDIVYR